MEHQVSLWIGFNVLVLGLLALDLGIFHRRAHEVSLMTILTVPVIDIVMSLVWKPHHTPYHSDTR